MLGGRRSFAEGGWAGTPVAEVLPVELDDGRAANRDVLLASCQRAAHARRRDVSGHAARRRRKGVGDEMGRHAAGETVNPIHAVKPGATVLLTGTDNRTQDQVVLAYQRYGRGKALAMPIQDSWIWKMDAEVAGRRHDARDVLAASGPLAGRRRARSGRRSRRRIDRVEPGEAIKLTAEVARLRIRRSERRRSDRAGHVAVGQDRPTCRSNGRSTKDGEYRRQFVPDETGSTRSRRRPPRERKDSARADAPARARPATPSTSTPRCARRCSSASRRRPAAASSRRPTRRRCPRPSATAAAASRWSKSAICGTCRSCSCCCSGSCAREWAFSRTRGLA